MWTKTKWSQQIGNDIRPRKINVLFQVLARVQIVKLFRLKTKRQKDKKTI